MILKQSAKDIATAFTKWGLWQGGGGSSALAELSDVEITDPQIEDVLQFDGNKWINAIIQGGGSLGGNVEFITTITTSSQIIDFSSHDLFLYVVFYPQTQIIGSAIYAKSDVNRQIQIPVEQGRRVTILDDNSIYEQPYSCIIKLYGIKFAPIEPNLHEYSTEEKVIGKWTNGKPLYEKTIITTHTLSGTSSALTVNIPQEVDYLDFKMDMERDGAHFNGNYFNNDNNYSIGCAYSAPNKRFDFRCGNGVVGRTYNIRVVFIYTKTTD